MKCKTILEGIAKLSPMFVSPPLLTLFRTHPKEGYTLLASSRDASEIRQAFLSHCLTCDVEQGEGLEVRCDCIRLEFDRA